MKMTARGRPSVSCKLSEGGCGWTGFVNAVKGVKLWEGTDCLPTAPAAIVEAKAPTAAAANPSPARRKSDKGGFKFPWEE